MIDTSWSSIRTFLIIDMGVVWFYLLNEHLRNNESDN